MDVVSGWSMCEGITSQDERVWNGELKLVVVSTGGADMHVAAECKEMKDMPVVVEPAVREHMTVVDRRKGISQTKVVASLMLMTTLICRCSFRQSVAASSDRRLCTVVLQTFCALEPS